MQLLKVAWVSGFVSGVAPSSLLLKLKVASLPEGMNYKHLIGVGLLASIGFTMSLFVANLAFDNNELIQQAKIGILIASLTGGTIGYFYLYFIKPKATIIIKERDIH